MRRIEKPAPDTRSQAAFSRRSDRRKQVSCPRTATASASARHLRRWPKPIVAAASVRKVKRFGKRGLYVPASVAAQRGAERLDDAVDVTLVHRRIERQRERARVVALGARQIERAVALPVVGLQMDRNVVHLAADAGSLQVLHQDRKSTRLNSSH